MDTLSLEFNPPIKKPTKTNHTTQAPQNQNQHPLEIYPDLLAQAAEKIHNAWKKRNPLTENNAALHTDYKNLPQKEKEKDISHLYTVCDLLDTTPRNGDSEKNYAIRLANAFGAIEHEKWRKKFDPENTGKEKNKQTSNRQTNINVPWKNLHPDWKKENFEAGLAAVQAYQELTRTIVNLQTRKIKEELTKHLKGL